MPNILTLGVNAERTSFVVRTTTSGWRESQSQSDLLLAAAGGSAVTMKTCKAWSMISHCSNDVQFIHICNTSCISNVTLIHRLAVEYTGYSTGDKIRNADILL